MAHDSIRETYDQPAPRARVLVLASQRRGEQVRQLVLVIVLSIGALAMILPFAWMLATSLSRSANVAMPRIKDFRGANPNAFDGHGNYTFGLTEQLVFPEIDYDRIDSVRGMNITIVTTAETDDHGRALLRALGFPFRRDGQG